MVDSRHGRGGTDPRRIGQNSRITRVHAARRTATFTESVIREMTRIASMHQAVNLAQGFPDFPMPDLMKDAACTAINGDINQYAVTWGTPVLRQAIAEKYRRWYNMEVDADRDVTVTCGATEAMASVFMALMDAGRRSDHPRAVL